MAISRKLQSQLNKYAESCPALQKGNLRDRYVKLGDALAQGTTLCATKIDYDITKYGATAPSPNSCTEVPMEKLQYKNILMSISLFCDVPVANSADTLAKYKINLHFYSKDDGLLSAAPFYTIPSGYTVGVSSIIITNQSSANPFNAQIVPAGYPYIGFSIEKDGAPGTQPLPNQGKISLYISYIAPYQEA